MIKQIVLIIFFNIFLMCNAYADASLKSLNCRLEVEAYAYKNLSSFEIFNFQQRGRAISAFSLGAFTLSNLSKIEPAIYALIKGDDLTVLIEDIGVHKTHLPIPKNSTSVHVIRVSDPIEFVILARRSPAGKIWIEDLLHTSTWQNPLYQNNLKAQRIKPVESNYTIYLAKSQWGLAEEDLFQKDMARYNYLPPNFCSK